MHGNTFARDKQNIDLNFYNLTNVLKNNNVFGIRVV